MHATTAASRWRFVFLMFELVYPASTMCEIDKLWLCNPLTKVHTPHTHAHTHASHQTHTKACPHPNSTHHTHTTHHIQHIGCLHMLVCMLERHIQPQQAPMHPTHPISLSLEWWSVPPPPTTMQAHAYDHYERLCVGGLIYGPHMCMLKIKSK